MIRTGKQYRDSIRDGREVYINGERVKDVTTHPMFKPLVDIRARIYDMQHEAATRAVLTYDEGGETLRHRPTSCRTRSRTGGTSAAPPTRCSRTSAASSPASATRRSARCGRSTTARTC